MQLIDLVGKHELSGVDYSIGTDGEMNVIFCLDGIYYEAKEDPDDGYRSYMKELAVTAKRCKNIFPAQPVICEHDGGVHDVLLVKDAESRLVVLEIGTRDLDDYYPICVMEYKPENMACNAERKREL